MSRTGYIKLEDELHTARYVNHVPGQNRIIELVRVVALAILTALDSYALHLVVTHQTRTRHTIWLGYKGEIVVEAVSLAVTATLFLSTAYLAFTTHSSTLRRIVSFLTNLSLFLAGIFYTYRDVYPLSTYTTHPIDPEYLPHPLAWTRVTLLLLSGLVIPLIQYRIYTPIDPSNPSPKPHPRQSSSILSRITYTFVDRIIFKAWRDPQIAHDDLPRVPDTDKASYLFKSVIPDIDPVERRRMGKKKRGLLTLIIGKYWGMYSTMAGMMLIKAVSEFASPVALNSLLSSLQNNQEGSFFRPWFWIALLAIGPTISSLSMAYYQSLGTTNLVRLECVFTELLFTHSLRIKVQDSTSSPTVTVPPVLSDDAEGLNKGQTEIVGNNQDQLTPQDPTSSSENKEPKAATTPAIDVKQNTPVAETKQASVAGRLNTLVTSDIDNILEAREIFQIILYGPVQIILGTFFLYEILSWSAFVGMAVTVLTLPVPGFLASRLNALQKAVMRKTDLRIQAVTEVLQTLKMIKLFAWESKVKEQIASKRSDELSQIWRRSLVANAIGGVNFLLPLLTMLATYGCYTGIQGRPLTAAKIFSSITVFDMIRSQMYIVSSQMQSVISARVSLKRLDDFFEDTEMLDRVEGEAHGEGEEIGFTDATFAWDKENKGERAFRLYIDKLEFPRNALSIITGPTGCGKTSLLMALLGELSFQATTPNSTFSLPRKGGVSYAAQDSWVMADTIRNNITFGTPFDPARYQMVIRQCALERDLELFAASDETELGDKGLNASGGQKARISLARAFYARTDIILLDDVLSALDVHTTQYIVDNLFRGDLAKDRTILLVTHHVSLVRPVADFMVTLSIDGEVASQGPVDKIASTPSGSGSETPAEDLVPGADKKDVPAADGKLVVAEEKGTGRVSRSALWTYFGYCGGVIFWTIFALDVLAGEFLFAFCNYFLGLWSKAYDTASKVSDVNLGWWMGIYVVLTILEVSAYNSQSLMWTFGSLKAANRLHSSLVDHVLGANMRFLDQTPVGRLIGRFTKDMKSVDTGLSRIFVGIAQVSVTISMKFVLLIWLVPAFAPYALLTGVLGLLLGEFYVKAQLSIKREMSNAKTPVYTHFSAASHGLLSIRAYGAEERLKRQLGDKADVYTATATIFYDVNRWIGVRIDFLGALFAAVLSACLVYGRKRLDVFVLGFAINQAISFAECILHMVRMSNMFEVEANGIERINDYLVIDQEAITTEKGRPPASWPTDGSIVVDNLSARYYPGGPVVLRDVSFSVGSGERVGIVGRTGSGKSTMTLALLRMIPTEGKIHISGLDTSSINLDSLRSQVTIIPQDPVLLAGTLRYNLDPFDVLDDSTLNSALDMSGLRSSTLSTSDTTIITLDTPITSGGTNLSSGQRQLVSLARALCRNSNIMILDEATASVDFATDALVQKAIRELKGVTILTVAHRLSTVMDYDKIAVLDAGRLVEFDSPAELLRRGGALRGMVDNASNKAELENLAGTPH